MIVVAILVAAVLIVGGLYVWYYSTIAGPIAQLAQNQKVLHDQVSSLPDIMPPSHLWPTYENKEAGFSIQYPPGWTYKDDNTGVFFQTELKSQFDTHTIRVKETKQTLEEWADSIDKSVVNRTIYMEIDNEPAIGFYNGELPPGLLLATKHDNKLYIFNSAGELMDRNNMLYLFKFIDEEENTKTEDINDIRYTFSNRGDMEFMNADTYRGLYNFTGKITVTGNYTYYKKNEHLLGGPDGNVCIENIKQSDINKFPIFKEDVRDVWFCFSNLDLAKKAFGPAGSKGEATVEIDNYTIDMMESEVWNMAELIKVIDKD